MLKENDAAYEATRAERFEKWLYVGDVPPSQTPPASSVAETELHAATELFRVQFHEYYPHRAPLLLIPLNEFKEHRMICTFIKPTVLPFGELFDLPTCARFIAGYMRYEPLDDPETLPDVVVSPATALQWQIGNCFELSLLLASLLAGAGYNVYVVVGSARRFVCRNDCSERLWDDADGLFNESDTDSEKEREVEVDAEYAALVKERPVLRGVDDSKLTDPHQPPDQQQQQQQEEEEKKKEEENTQRKALNELTTPNTMNFSTSVSVPVDREQTTWLTTGTKQPRPDIWAPRDWNQNQEPRLLHSWVLVLPGGRRSQKEAVFVEPSTGELIPQSAADVFYTSIDAVFNRRNYRVNLTPDAPVSTLTLDLKDGVEWEGVVFDADAEEDRDAMSHVAGGGDRLSHSTTPALRWRQHNADLNSTGPALGHTVATTYAASGPAGCVFPAAAATVNLLALTTRDKSLQPFNISWVGDLTLSREQYERRYPGGMKVIRYANAEVRWFAEYTRPDLRVLEVRLPDTTYRHRKQIHILFKHRVDKLRRCSIYPTKDEDNDNENYIGGGGCGNVESFRLLKKWYDRGRMRDAAVEGLRLLTHEFGVQRTMTFYWDARDDGLWRRQELFYDGCVLRKVKEFYRQRDDRLWYRGATFERNVPFLRTSRQRGSVYGERQVDETQRVEPVRVSEKYHRNEALSADEDVAKYTFVRPAGGSGGGEMWVFFHYRPNSITRPYRMYLKGARGEEYLATAVSGGVPSAPQCTMVLMPNAEEPSELEQYKERKRLAWYESVCVGKLRGMMSECAAILSSIRDTEGPEVQGVLSVFDTLRNRPRETEVERARKLAEKAAREASRKDYLAPYIAKLELSREFDGDYLNVFLTPSQAQQVRDEALRELKERLIQRGHIMQAQMDAEKKEFNDRQVAYQDRLDAAGLDAGRDEEEFAQYCKEATWRMKTLDERLSKHIDHSSEKYAKLAQRLAEDPRLAALYKT